MIENQETKTNQKSADEVLPTAACSASEEYAKNGHKAYETIKGFIREYTCGNDDDIYNIKWDTGEMMDVFCDIIEKRRSDIEDHYRMMDIGITPRDIFETLPESL